jgi:hypothetical protein
MNKTYDITDQQFGKLVVLRREGKDRHGASTWFCRCSCGEECVVLGTYLRRGKKVHCGKCEKPPKQPEEKRVWKSNGSKSKPKDEAEKAFKKPKEDDEVIPVHQQTWWIAENQRLEAIDAKTEKLRALRQQHGAAAVSGAWHPKDQTTTGRQR